MCEAFGKTLNRCSYFWAQCINVANYHEIVAVKELLEEKYLQYNTPGFIHEDPVSIPHQYEQKENIEIAGFIAATLAWGQRNTIIRNAGKILSLMGNSPYHFLLSADEEDFNIFHHFVHRTFNGTDACYFIRSLSNLYRNYGSMYEIFVAAWKKHQSLEAGMSDFRRIFFELPHEQRTEKHLANIHKGAAGKRLNMFLRWMVRKDDRGVDFGIWQEIPASALFIPLDIHTGTVARHLGLLNRKQNDWKAVLELTNKLREFDPEDPVKYDFSLFGMGVYE
jgi:uncharacterized protein (TIGR02757 family)